MKKANHIVLIDDNKIDCFINQKIITLANGNTVTKTFHNGADALDYFIKTPKDSKKISLFNTDIIFLDINMPVMNGFELLNELSKLKPFIDRPIEVYFLSSSINEDDVASALNTPHCSGYLNKPLTKEIIYNILNFNEPIKIRVKPNDFML